MKKICEGCNQEFDDATQIPVPENFCSGMCFQAHCDGQFGKAIDSMRDKFFQWTIDTKNLPFHEYLRWTENEYKAFIKNREIPESDYA